jgi:transmembrane sensor
VEDGGILTVDDDNEISATCAAGEETGRETDTQAMAWVMRIASGEATAADAAALQRWRDQSPANHQAFAQAKLLWEVLGPAARELELKQAAVVRVPRARSRPTLGRRAFIGGALAASAAGVTYVGSQPPFRFWPSLGEMQADYRTAVGEQRQIAVVSDVALMLNTRTSIGVRSNARGIDLISGEASITTSGRDVGQFEVYAAGGRTTAAVARFDMRRDGENVCITCLAGSVDVSFRNDTVTLQPAHQVTYDSSGLRRAAPVDVTVVTAWQQGQLMFRHAPLSRVVDEVNRYRAGRIVILNEALAQRDVVATFQLSRLDQVVDHLTQAFNARARFLPGGLVLLS